MNILIVASEAHPFIKTGGLGDVIGALPVALNDLGADVRVVIPNYRDIKKEIKENLKYIDNFTVNVGWRNQYCGILEYEHEGVKFYLLDNEYYFNRGGLYGYYDDGEKFAFFDRAVLEFVKHIDWVPDILHCNDWQTGMVPVLLKLEYSKEEKFKNMKTMFSIHNLFFKGMFDPKVLPELFGYDYESFNNGSLEHYGAVSFLKGGINYADKVTTVSKSYAEEIKTPEYGEQLEGLLRYRSSVLEGIVNGIDYKEYNPEEDKYIYSTYSVNDLENKKINKEELQKELGLTVNKDVPMIGLVSRLTHQKGCDLIINILEELLKEDIQVVVLGTGDYMYEESFKSFQGRHPNKISANIKFSNELAHKIYAASDMFLMPSLFEPCGLGQLIALRYGSIPIVRETGGLKDTVTPYNEYDETGNGFGFKNYRFEELLNIIKYALKIYENKDKWNNIVRQAMSADNSWEKSAKEYIEIYNKLITNNDNK
ncbi:MULTISPECIES: glycogen synthase GlgA [Clostridium]|uniref:glycogen synthase GlgA n=1 Tax=Clostridium TaxID=1485 RepID=UPI00019B0515|nr:MULTISPECIES: glycogen synthase GlgA [Clostridium]EEH99794.1 glycogen/starch synthase, ADP-glucose type [Clostridium sp. 7_2_43FAA]MBP1870274.1 starch synthase [Clostridium tertium]MBU6137374.1 glycogen synthase GlgA [Clostridium tertium]MDB1941562.1 glycogen synthase GlgA [Clostridium tertium]MDB1956947.1 glycogen synthase GlgA [Clostridium tertium]